MPREKKSPTPPNKPHPVAWVKVAGRPMVPTMVLSFTQTRIVTTFGTFDLVEGRWQCIEDGSSILIFP